MAKPYRRGTGTRTHIISGYDNSEGNGRKKIKSNRFEGSDVVQRIERIVQDNHLPTLKKLAVTMIHIMLG
jgi:hypothetical protein